MSVQVFHGTIQELGSGTITAQIGHGHSVLSFLEFTDGRILHRVDAHGGLIGKLEHAVDQGQPIELHVLQRGKKRWTVFGLRGPDGRLYATELSQHAWLMYGLTGLMLLLNIVLLPLFGLGIFFLYAAWVFGKSCLQIRGVARHLAARPEAIFLE
ncbi:MAG: hypothetical protein PGN26_15550 [Xylophilus ampelinus]